jgi:parallel beta-helix repeat protein
VLAWSLLASGLASAQVTPITSCPVVISQPGGYQVTQNLTCPAAPAAITINASSVVLDLGFHSVYGGVGHGIVVGAVSGVMIIRGTVVDFDGHGILLQNTSRSVISQITTTHNGGAGIWLENASSNVIATNSVSNSVNGIVLANSATLNAIHNNSVASSLNGGIVLINGANNNGVWSNTVSSSAGAGGIVVNTSTGNVISINSAAGNTPFDLADSDAACDNNLWVFNTTPITSVNQSCIH